MGEQFARNRDWVALRGAAAMIFGLITLFTPTISLAALEFFFGTFALVDGAFSIATAVSRRRPGQRWAGLLVGGLLGAAIGVVTFVLPRMTALALLYIIAAWALVTGISHIDTAFRLPKAIRGDRPLIVTGVLWIVLGVLLAAFPATGILARLAWVGAFATAAGIVLLGLAFRLWRGRPGAPGEEGVPRAA